MSAVHLACYPVSPSKPAQGFLRQSSSPFVLLMASLILPAGRRSPGAGTASGPAMWGRPRSCWGTVLGPAQAANGFRVFAVAGCPPGHGHPVSVGHPAAGPVQGADRHR